MGRERILAPLLRGRRYGSIARDAVQPTRHDSFEVPDVLQFAPSPPKTRSGKIIPRILRKIAENQTDSFGDVFTLVDPTVIDALIANRKADLIQRYVRRSSCISDCRASA